MLSATSHRPDEVVGRMRPTQTQEDWEYTVEKVAVNAVMAGAEPSFFPVILALAATQETALHSSTSSFASMAVVNGPIRHEIGMNGGLGALGPFNHANASHRPRLQPPVSKPRGRRRSRDHLPRVSGQPSHVQRPLFPRERGEEPLGALPREQRLQTRRECRERL